MLDVSGTRTVDLLESGGVLRVVFAVVPMGIGVVAFGLGSSGARGPSEDATVTLGLVGVVASTLTL